MVRVHRVHLVRPPDRHGVWVVDTELRRLSWADRLDLNKLLTETAK